MGPWAFGVPVTLVSALGLLLNAYILLVVVVTKQTQTANTVLLVHLGAVEAALCSVLLVFTTGGSSWPNVGTPCAFHGFLLAVLHPVALWTVTGLNCDRYYAIASPLHYAALVSPRRVTFGLGAAWAGALLLCLPPLSGLVPPYRYSPGLGWCAPDLGGEGWGAAAILYGTIYVLLGVVLPAAVVTVCNLRVLSIARYHRHRIASAIYEVTLSAQVTITHQRNPFSFIPNVTAPSAGGPPRFHSAASTVVQLLGSLYLLYFPFCGLLVWNACEATLTSHSHHGYGYGKTRTHFGSLAALLLACSPPVNGLLYGLKSRTLRRSMKNYWRKKATKSELQQEIQARTPSMAGSRRASTSLPATPLFPLPPLQRRLSEALLGLASPISDGKRRGSRGHASQMSRLHPVASYNTLRLPTNDQAERGVAPAVRKVRTSASAASLTGSRYRGDGNESPGEVLRRSPRILITRAHSEDSQEDGSSPLRRPFAGSSKAPLLDRRKYRQSCAESDGSGSDGGIWTTGVSSRLVNSDDSGGKAVKEDGRIRTLEEGTVCDTRDIIATINTTLLNKAAPASNRHENAEVIGSESSCKVRVKKKKKEGNQNHDSGEVVENDEEGGEHKMPLLTFES